MNFWRRLRLVALVATVLIAVLTLAILAVKPSGALTHHPSAPSSSGTTGL